MGIRTLRLTRQSAPTRLALRASHPPHEGEGEVLAYLSATRCHGPAFGLTSGATTERTPHDRQTRRNRQTHRIDHPRPDPGLFAGGGLHGGQHLSGPEGRPDLRLGHSGGGHLHGPAARLQGLDHLGEHDGSDRRLGRRRHELHHLRPARPGHDRLVDELPLLGVGGHLRARRGAGRDLLHSAAPDPGGPGRPALPRGRRRRRGSEGRLARRR